jgi:hypothetical protein
MDLITPEYCEWLEHLSEAKLRNPINQLSANPKDAQRDYIEVLRVLLADRIGRRAFWTGRGNTKPAPLR